HNRATAVGYLPVKYQSLKHLGRLCYMLHILRRWKYRHASAGQLRPDPLALPLVCRQSLERKALVYLKYVSLNRGVIGRIASRAPHVALVNPRGVLNLVSAACLLGTSLGNPEYRKASK